MAEQVLTTQTTATTGVAPAVQTVSGYTEWQIAGIIASGIIATVMMIGGILAIINFWHGWRRDRESDEERQTGTQRTAMLDGQRTILTRMDENKSELRGLIEDRTSGLEQRVSKIEREYRSQTELDRDYGRLQAGQEQVERGLRELAQRVTAGERAQARLEALQEATASQVSEVKAAVDRLGDRIDDRFDKLMDSIAARAAH